MMIKKYVLNADFEREKLLKGKVVWELSGYDYGLSSDDSRLTGIHHTSVTFNEKGDYPGFTIPTHFLDEVKEETVIIEPWTPEWWEENAETAREYFGVNK